MPYKEGTYRIRNDKYGKYLSIAAGGEKAEAAEVDYEDMSQRWQIHPLDAEGHYTFQNVQTGKYLQSHDDWAGAELRHTESADEATVWTMPWNYTAVHVLVKDTNDGIDLDNTDATAITRRPYLGDAWQRWKLEEIVEAPDQSHVQLRSGELAVGRYKIVNAADSTLLDGRNDDSVTTRAATDDRYQLWDLFWDLKFGRHIRLRNVRTGRYLYRTDLKSGTDLCTILDPSNCQWAADSSYDYPNLWSLTPPEEMRHPDDVDELKAYGQGNSKAAQLLLCGDPQDKAGLWDFQRVDDK